MQSELHKYKARIYQAVSLLIIGFLGFSIADLCSKILQDHYTIYQVLSVSGFIGMAISGTWLATRHGFAAFFPHNLKLHVIRGLVVLVTAFCMVSALRTLPMADFYGVVFLSPFIMLILSVIFLKEHVGWRRWSAVTVAFCGVLVLAGPQFNHLGEGFLYAMVGAFCSATSVVILRKIGRDAPLPLYGFYPSLCITVFSLVMLCVTGSFRPFEMGDLGYFAFHGPAATVGVLCTSLGYARSPEASIVAPFMYTQIIWGVLFGWIFFMTIPSTFTAIGLAMIIGAGCYSIWREHKNAHDKHKIIEDNT